MMTGTVCIGAVVVFIAAAFVYCMIWFLCRIAANSDDREGTR